jgi:hypothetical protein
VPSHGHALARGNTLKLFNDNILPLLQPSAACKLLALSMHHGRSWWRQKQALRGMNLGGMRIALRLLEYIPQCPGMLWLHVACLKVCDQEHT